ncbi:putative 7-carboxy-7-deazaguanine synthase QueE [Anaerotalea alkaliphila]|uniref:7-carboxy-7-deazaguanine synthase n=1 Tax=Anaerotalea alkaliphila TaxID=2662126 RepID=A0A7X5HXT5_9FIRM|nr:putative 7-carboxy-7-deazaguanine synthase QueE [Anaerotalea alkaliphila]NDL68638.1 putative 7-carboxy-7-deazaguanine synthase QueE [Anaerotalea alkaliphila]
MKRPPTVPHTKKSGGFEVKVVEKFTSVNGEGPLCGQLATFIRFAGCNLKCSYCDTAWANDGDVPCAHMEPDEIHQHCKSIGIRNITLTGGEPLLQDGIDGLLVLLSRDRELHVEIETNGSVPLDRFSTGENGPSFTMDYKLPSSGMEHRMLVENFKFLQGKDTVKFVAGNSGDLERAVQVIREYGLVGRTNVHLSPVYGEIGLESMVAFMKDKGMNGVNLQLQLHKIIWEPSRRGV